MPELISFHDVELDDESLAAPPPPLAAPVEGRAPAAAAPARVGRGPVVAFVGVLLVAGLLGAIMMGRGQQPSPASDAGVAASTPKSSPAVEAPVQAAPSSAAARSVAAASVALARKPLAAPIAAPKPQPRSHATKITSKPLPAVHLRFAFGSHRLAPPERRRLVALAAKARGRSVIVYGHADVVGTKAHNFALSRQRAEHVAAELRRVAGASQVRVAAIARGDRQPLVPNTIHGHPWNRRVDVVVGGPL